MNKFLNLNKSFINGSWIDVNEGNTVDMTNPYNDESLAKVKLASMDQLNEVFAGARRAQNHEDKILRNVSRL